MYSYFILSSAFNGKIPVLTFIRILWVGCINADQINLNQFFMITTDQPMQWQNSNARFKRLIGLLINRRHRELIQV